MVKHRYIKVDSIYKLGWNIFWTWQGQFEFQMKGLVQFVWWLSVLNYSCNAKFTKYIMEMQMYKNINYPWKNISLHCGRHGSMYCIVTTLHHSTTFVFSAWLLSIWCPIQEQEQIPIHNTLCSRDQSCYSCEVTI